MNETTKELADLMKEFGSAETYTPDQVEGIERHTVTVERLCIKLKDGSERLWYKPQTTAIHEIDLDDRVHRKTCWHRPKQS